VIPDIGLSPVRTNLGDNGFCYNIPADQDHPMNVPRNVCDFRKVESYTRCVVSYRDKPMAFSGTDDIS